jgi:peptide chain release factor subunit 1
MLTPDEIERLEAFDGGGAPVLSVYLDLDPGRRVARAYRVAFENLVKEVREPLPEPARAELARETAAVDAWLEGQAPEGKGLALFSCTPRRFWHARGLAVTVRDHLAFEPRADVAPLLALLDEYERYAVALVDKRTARLLTVFLGEIEEVERFEDEVPGKHDQGGVSQANFQRHHEAHVHWHLARVTRSLAGLRRRRPFDRLIVAGPPEITAELRRLLPRAFARRLAEVMPGRVAASDAEILAMTLEIESRVEREVEARLLRELFDLAGSGGRATLGVRPTLDALWADAVQTLVVAAGAGEPGSECVNCGRLEPGNVAACPACGRAMRLVHDVVHRAMMRTREQAGAVEVVHGVAARRLQESWGGLGALLRYPWAESGMRQAAG